MACWVLSVARFGSGNRGINHARGAIDFGFDRVDPDGHLAQLGFDQAEIAEALAERGTLFGIFRGDFQNFFRAAQAIGAQVNRPAFSVLNATTWPRPGSCSRFSFGTGEFSKKIAVVELPLMPIFFSSAPAEKPGVPRSTMKQENFSPSILAKTTKTSAKPPLVIHIFWPFRM